MAHDDGNKHRQSERGTIRKATWLLCLCLLLLAAGCGPAMADTTPPDLTRLGYTQQNNPDLKAPAVVSLLGALRLLSPQTAVTVAVIQELTGCLVESKVVQWALYTDPKNRLTAGLVLKASKNGLTDPNTIVNCLAQKFQPRAADAQFQLCSRIGEYTDDATKDTVYVAYVADETTLCNAIIGSLPPLQPLKQ